MNNETLHGGDQKPEGWTPVPPEVKLKELREFAENIGQSIEHTFPGGEKIVITPTTGANQQPRVDTPAAKPRKGKLPVPANKANRDDNLRNFTGFRNGTYYLSGVAQRKKVK